MLAMFPHMLERPRPNTGFASSTRNYTLGKHRMHFVMMVSEFQPSQISSGKIMNVIRKFQVKVIKLLLKLEMDHKLKKKQRNLLIEWRGWADT